MSIKMYIKLDLTFLGLKVLNVGMFIIEKLNQVLDKEHQTKLTGIVGWNLIQLFYNTFIPKYGTTVFDSFKCPEGVDPLLFSQLCIFHYSDIQKNRHSEQHPESGPNKFNRLIPQRQMTCPEKTNKILKETMEPYDRLLLAQRKTMFVSP